MTRFGLLSLWALFACSRPGFEYGQIDIRTHAAALGRATEVKSIHVEALGEGIDPGAPGIATLLAKNGAEWRGEMTRIPTGSDRRWPKEKMQTGG